MVNVLLVGLVGLGVGWLVGLSQSPVVAGAIAALLAAAGALVGSLGKFTAKGSDTQPNAGDTPARNAADLLNPLPLAALVLGIAVGAPLGLYARTSAWFSPPIAAPAPPLDFAAIVTRWEELGLRREDVVQRLFERELPLPGTSAAAAATGESKSVPVGLVAGAGFADECAGFRMAARDKTLFELRGSRRPAVRKLADALAPSASPEIALLMLEVVCPTER